MFADERDYQLLRAIPGIGPINALTILAEAGDLRRFAHHHQFLRYCGVDLSTQQSGVAHRARTVAIVARTDGAPDGDRLDGQLRGQTRLSKFGNARLRRALWMAGQVAIRQRDNSFRSKFECHAEPGCGRGGRRAAGQT